MSTASETTIQVLIRLVQVVSVGTNLALLQLMWAMLNGSFIRSRGAVMTALHLSGFSPGQVRRSWQALRYGVWGIGEMLGSWRGYVLAEGQWQVHRYEGYEPLAADVLTFWRPRLQGWAGKFFHSIANRAMTGVGFGVITQVGQVGNQRLPLLRHLIRSGEKVNSDKALQSAVLEWVGGHLASQEVLLYDGGAHLSDLEAARIPRYVLRLATNCTARRSELPPREKKKGRPAEYGQLVRPLARSWKGQEIAATQPDDTTTFTFADRTIEVSAWRHLVRTDQKVNPDQATFTIWVYRDPAYRHPLVLATNLTVQAQTVYLLYRDRWPVEQIPLAAKQMLGLHRHFVFAPLCCYRLPELALLLGNVLTYLAAVLPPVPTAFWDRHPKKRPAVSAASWLKPIFQMWLISIANFGKNALLLTTYPRGLRLIGEPKPPLDPFFPFAEIVSPYIVNVLSTKASFGLYFLPITG